MRTASLPGRPAGGLFRSRRLLALARDDTLALQIQRGNEAAFEAVFERYGAGILGFCRHMLGSVEEAEDAAQQTFASAFRDLQRGEERELALKPWLYAIARNRCLSLLRSRRDHVALEADVPTRGLADQVEKRAELRDLLRDLRELPRDQRAALLLAEVGALSHAEVGQVLGCETAKVKALVFRARTGLIRRREARETPCVEIRRQLATLRGGSLRRSELRHHLRECAGCRAYRQEIDKQRKMLAAALPVAPSLGLKTGVLAAIGLGGGSSGGGLAAGVGGLGTALSSALGGSTAAKVAAVGLLAGGGAAAVTTVGEDPSPAPPSPVVASPSPPVRDPGAGAARGNGGGSVQAARRTVPVAEHEAAKPTDARPRRAPTATEPQRRMQHGRRQASRKNAASHAPGQEPGRQSQAVPVSQGAKPEPRGRGPIAAPPATVPVKRGPPHPTQKAPKPAKLKTPPPGHATAHDQQPPAAPAAPGQQLPAAPAAPPKRVKAPKH